MITTVQELWFVVCGLTFLIYIYVRRVTINILLDMEAMEERILGIVNKYEDKHKELESDLMRLESRIRKLEKPHEYKEYGEY